MNALLRHLRRASLLITGGGPSDDQLLESFASRRDQAAFEALVRRHGPMVLGVCRRILGNRHDAEDAFQATFLVLVRKAGGLRSPDLLGNWLYGVAYRTARRARAMSARRRQKEHEAAGRSAPSAAAEVNYDHLLPLLDQELARLPDKYRLAVVLCDLEGKSRKLVAGLLRIPEGTLSSRLAYARKRLAHRLSRPGLVLPAGALAAVLCHNAALAQVPGPLVRSTTKAALGQAAPGAAVVTLTQETVKAMFIAKLKVVSVVALAVVLGAGALGLAYQAVAAGPQGPQVGQYAQKQRPKDAEPAAQTDNKGSGDELEALRLEIEALRKGLQATRARVQILEKEVRTLRGAKGALIQKSNLDQKGLKQDDKALNDYANKYPPKRLPDKKGQSDHANKYPPKGLSKKAWGQKGEHDPLAELQGIAKKLRQHDPEAADALERALKLLKMRQDQKAPAKR
jgi:RNA polymerase sigma factor (sigma-70 family)